jgi:2-keto-3-deoxy-L-rhamnonate aldolase RhmA
MLRSGNQRPEEARMPAVVNHALRQLREGKLAIGMGLRQARTVDIAQIAKTAGFDWLFIDREHSSMGLDMAAQIAAASLAVGIAPLVRVPGYEHYHASRMLDNGAQGVVVPHVDTAEMAQRVADHCRFPPVGRRSMGGGLQQTGFAPMPIGEVARVVNDETLVVVMIESPQGVANCEAIAAVPGIDALLIGTNDLCFEMGIPGNFTDARVADAYTKVIAACRKHGKFPGMGGMYTPELLERFIGMGARLILAGSDFSFLMQGATARASQVRGFQKK